MRMGMLRGSGLLLATTLLVLATQPACGDLPRNLLTGSPKILGREVKELTLLAPVHVGKELPPGLPTTLTYTMAPNRFRPVAEDAEGVFYEAVGPLVKHRPPGGGGIYMSKRYPDKLIPYVGEAQRLRLPVTMLEPLSPFQARKFRVRFASANPR